ncbi:hypothetical protein VR46_29015, partial [Streptomyces sp. NRRL S-444]
MAVPFRRRASSDGRQGPCLPQSGVLAQQVQQWRPVEGGDRLEQVGVTQQGGGVLFVVAGAGETGEITGLATIGEVVGVDGEGGVREEAGGPFLLYTSL